MLSLLSGCRNNADSGFEAPEFVFVPEFVDIPGNFESIFNLTYANDKIYFTTQVLIDEETFTYAFKLFSMNIDGTDLAELANYDPGDPPYEDALGDMMVEALSVDSNGNLWVLERGYFYRINESGDYNSGDIVGVVPLIESMDANDEEHDDVERLLPDSDDPDNEEDEENDDFFDDAFDDSFDMPAFPDVGGGGEWEDLGEVIALRKLDGTGAQLLSVDLISIVGRSDQDNWRQVTGFSIDDAGNIYISAFVNDDTNVFVLSNEGKEQFTLNMRIWGGQLVKMPDGSVAFTTREESGLELKKIDYAAGGWGETVELPSNIWNILPGGGDFDLIFSTGNNLSGFVFETGEVVALLNWIDSGIITDGLDNITVLHDGRVLCTTRTWDMQTWETSFELIILTKTPYSELPERTALTLATFWLDFRLQNSIVQFNRTNPSYRIHVTDYSEFSTDDDWGAGLTRLSAEIISGRIPDMLAVANLPYRQYVARGLLEDLYPFIDSDPEFNRNDFVEEALRASEMDGGLYQVFPSFSINSLVGHPMVIGEGMGWNMDEFKAVLDANPQADMPMGEWLTKASFLEMTLRLGMDEYVDWINGTAHFDSGDFAQLLEFANTFPENFDFYDGGFSRRIYVSDAMTEGPPDLIATGRQIMSMAERISDFSSIQMYINMFGGDIVFKGFPTESRNGNTLTIDNGLAITTRSSNKEGAWEFMRTILTKDWQLSNTWEFPTNKAAFNEKVEQAMAVEEDSGGMGWDGFFMYNRPLTQAELDQTMRLIDTVSGVASWDVALMNIIMENANDYFNGLRSAQDAARIIQSQASIYVAEQS